MKSHSVLRYAIAILVTFLTWTTAEAETREFGYHGWGIRGGISSDPDQFFVGAHLDLGDFVENVQFRPNATIGFGDDITLFSVNPDVSYRVDLEDTGSLYFGGILALQYFKYDVPEGYEDILDDTDTEVGFHAIAGLELDSVPVLVELNIGIDETPDLKAAIGYTFR